MVLIIPLDTHSIMHLYEMLLISLEKTPVWNFLLSDKSYKEQKNCIQLNTEIEDKCNLTLVLPIPGKGLYVVCNQRWSHFKKYCQISTVTEISKSEVHHQNCKQQRSHSSGKTRKYYFWRCREFQSREHTSNKNWTSSASNRHWKGKLKDLSWQAAIRIS